MASGTTAADHLVVQLRYAPLPFIGAIAVHYWFVVIDKSSGETRRWEVWQTKNAGGRSIGHVHCDLKTPEAGVGGGPSRIALEWRSREAEAIDAVLRHAARYPYCSRYLVWPGPNSNTFVAWVLQRAGIDCKLGWRGIGKGFRVVERNKR
jgi:uncharacterized protein DUF3750